MEYIRVITHLLTIDPNFQRDIPVTPLCVPLGFGKISPWKNCLGKSWIGPVPWQYTNHMWPVKQDLMWIFAVKTPGRWTTWNLKHHPIEIRKIIWILNQTFIFGFQHVNFAGCISNSASVAKQQKRWESFGLWSSWTVIFDAMSLGLWKFEEVEDGIFLNHLYFSGFQMLVNNDCFILVRKPAYIETTTVGEGGDLLFFMALNIIFSIYIYRRWFHWDMF